MNIAFGQPGRERADQVSCRMPDDVGLPFFPAPSLRIAIVLTPGFSQLALGAMLEPFGLANTLTGASYFDCVLAGSNGAPVKSASGVDVPVQTSFSELRRAICATRSYDLLVVCGGWDIERTACGDLKSILRMCARQSLVVVTLGTATWVLAELGLLSNANCTIHWEKIPSFSEQFQEVHVQDVLYIRDGQFVTCAGGLAAFDLAQDIIRQRLGDDIAHNVCRYFTADGWRQGETRQAAPRGLRLAGASEKLIAAIAVMERNIEEPLSLERIAADVKLSRRQLERLFRQHLSQSPLRYYTEIRLERARNLLENTGMSLVTIAIACGFASPSNFSKRFREFFGYPPSSFR